MGNLKLVYSHLERTKADKQGNASVQLRIYKDRLYRYCITGISVQANQWDAKQQRVRNHNQQIKYNLRLQGIKRAANSFAADNPNCSARDIKMFVLGEIEGRGHDFFSFCYRIIDQSDLAENTLKQDKLFLSYLFDFDPHTNFKKIDYGFVSRFSSFLLASTSQRGRKLHPNYVASILSKLKKYCNEARRHELMTKDPFAFFQIRKQPTVKVALTLSELKNWEETNPYDLVGKGSISDSWLVFLFGCYTGLRYSDLMQLSWGNFTEDLSVLEIMPQKTKKKKTIVTLPLCDLFQGKSILLLNESQPRPLPKLSNHSYNAALKVIAKQIGIKKHITAHTSRHTFGTVLTDLGIPIEIIRDLMGHASVTVTEVYAKVRGKTISNALKNKF